MRSVLPGAVRSRSRKPPVRPVRPGPGRSRCRPTSATPPRCGRCSPQVKDKFGRVDVLFNNAGVGVPGTVFGDLTDEQWQKVVDINLTGAFYCAREAFRVMREQSPQGGRIINNGSISAHVPRPGSAPYTATKHAITGLTRTISLDGRPYDIACGQIDIGNAATEMAARMAKGVPQADGSTRVEPLMDVNHVASAVVLHGESAARDQRPVHDHHGDQDAVHRPRLSGRSRGSTSPATDAVSEGGRSA